MSAVAMFYTLHTDNNLFTLPFYNNTNTSTTILYSHAGGFTASVFLP